MALRKCPDCGRECSAGALKCPGCGGKLRENYEANGLSCFAAAAIALVLSGWALGRGAPPAIWISALVVAAAGTVAGGYYIWKERSITKQ